VSRILVLSHHGRSVAGGATLADAALADALAEPGNEVDLLFFEDVLSARVRGTWRLLLFPWAAARAFLRRHATARYDVVESTAGDAWLITLLLRLFPGPRPLLSIRTHGLEHRRAELDAARRQREGRPIGFITRLFHFRWRLWEVTRDLRTADAVFLLNREDRDYAVTELGIDAARIHTLSNGLPTYLMSMGGGDDNPERLFRLLFLGVWSPVKGADLLPAIVSRAFADDPRWRLTCAGVQTTPEKVLAAFDPAHRSRVEVIPRYGHRDLPEILRRHGVFLLPSPAEGCSLALLEAMAGGLVPVTTRTGYAADLIAPGRNGFLAEPGDVEGPAAALRELAADPERASRIGLSARAAMADHSWTARVAERVRIWDSLDDSGGKAETGGSDGRT
jgi:glycosyltransferase involved in cell wall biosynthesis